MQLVFLGDKILELQTHAGENCPLFESKIYKWKVAGGWFLKQILNQSVVKLQDTHATSLAGSTNLSRFTGRVDNWWKNVSLRETISVSGSPWPANSWSLAKYREVSMYSPGSDRLPYIFICLNVIHRQWTGRRAIALMQPGPISLDLHFKQWYLQH